MVLIYNVLNAKNFTASHLYSFTEAICNGAPVKGNVVLLISRSFVNLTGQSCPPFKQQISSTRLVYIIQAENG